GSLAFFWDAYSARVPPFRSAGNGRRHRCSMFQVDAPSGVIGFWDSASVPPCASGDMRLPAADLRELAKNGELFFIDAEDPVICRIEVVTENELPAAYRDEFEACGGAFRLRLPSGRLRIGSLPPGTNDEEKTVAAGEYLVLPYSRREFEVARYDQKMIA